MKKGFDFISIIFWIAVIFYLDPGGFISIGAAQDVDATRTVVYKFGTIALLFAGLIFKFNSNEYKLINDRFLLWYGIIILIWSVYYFLWFYGLNNSTSVSPLRMITRNQRMIGQILLVFPVAYFASIDLNNFIKIFSWSTLIIMIMYILSIFLKMNLVELDIGSRGMGLSVNRYFMYGYGIMYFMVPVALSFLLMKYKNEKIMILAAILVALHFFLSILRREIIGIIEHLIIIAFLVNYIYQGKPLQFLWRFINIKSIAFVAVVIIIVVIISPNLVETVTTIAEETYRRTILGEGGADATDEARMSLTAMYGMVKVIEENLFLGSGYLREFFIEENAKGLEGADYVFLSAFGMYGIVGLIIFLPFYILTVKLIIRLVKLIRYNLEFIKNNNKEFIYPVIIGLASSSEFIKNIIEYPNWYWPIGANMYSPRFFIYFGLLIGCYYQIKKKIIISKLKQYNE